MSTPEEFKIHFNYADFITYGHQLSKQLGVPFENDEIIIPAHIGRGHLKFFKINDFLSYQIAHYTPVLRMVFDRFPTEEGHILINFRNFTFEKSDSNTNLCPEVVLHKNSLGSIHCKSTRQSEQIVINPGQEIKIVLVLLKEGWLENILHESASKDKFTRYLVKQNESLNLRKEFLSPEQNKLFTKLFSGKTCFLMQNLYYDGRVLNLLESFLKEVLVKEENESPYLFASYDDIHALQRAENYINENLMNPFPGVEVLSRISCMSRTKFINLFQKVYGISSFEYSQKKRLSKSFEYLKSGKYSVSDTAQMIGYAGVNNFAVAFKKEFDMLPSELLGNVKERVAV